MAKLTLASFFIVPLVSAALLFTIPASSMSKQDVYEFAQQSILFYRRCDSESDCEPEEETIEIPKTTEDHGAKLIVNFAIEAAWPNENGQCRDGETYADWSITGTSYLPLPEGCRSTVTDLALSKGFEDGWRGGASNNLMDCGKFVGFVLRNTVDPEASSGGTWSQTNHMDATPSKWKKVSTTGQEFPMAMLQPGDILEYGDRNGGSEDGHIYIYIGERRVKCGNSECSVNIAEASFRGRSPYLRKKTNTWYYFNDGSHAYYNVYRYIGS